MFAEIYTPKVMEKCLFPPNSRSQCANGHRKGVGCVNGECHTLYLKLCTQDDDCGHTSESRLQCINGWYMIDHI